MSDRRDHMPLATGSCFDQDGNLLALYRDAAMVAGWLPPDALATRDADLRERIAQAIEKSIHWTPMPGHIPVRVAARIARTTAAANTSAAAAEKVHESQDHQQRHTDHEPRDQHLGRPNLEKHAKTVDEDRAN